MTIDGEVVHDNICSYTEESTEITNSVAME